MVRRFHSILYRISFISIIAIFVPFCISVFIIPPTAIFAQTKKQQTIHVVQPGETLINIAFRYDVSLLRLALYNNIANVQNIRLGQIILIPDELEFTPQVLVTHASLQKFANQYGWTIIQEAPPEQSVTEVQVQEIQTLNSQNVRQSEASSETTETDSTIDNRQSTVESAWIQGVPQNAQALNLSCESRSAADLAGYYGIDIDELEFFSNIPISDNPHFGFVGDPNDEPGSLPPNGYGVYAEPIASTLQKYDICAEAQYHLGLEGLKDELAHGRPVIIWATYDMVLQPIYEYISQNRVAYEVIPYQHTFIAIGYDTNGIQLIDAYDGLIKYYDYDTFNAAWKLLDQMAVTTCKK